MTTLCQILLIDKSSNIKKDTEIILENFNSFIKGSKYY